MVPAEITRRVQWRVDGGRLARNPGCFDCDRRRRHFGRVLHLRVLVLVPLNLLDRTPLR
jgi:hypothetical protein